jgi:hypothetical protein
VARENRVVGARNPSKMPCLYMPQNPRPRRTTQPILTKPKGQLGVTTSSRPTPAVLTPIRTSLIIPPHRNLSRSKIEKKVVFRPPRSTGLAPHNHHLNNHAKSSCGHDWRFTCSTQPPPVAFIGVPLGFPHQNKKANQYMHVHHAVVCGDEYCLW